MISWQLSSSFVLSLTQLEHHKTSPLSFTHSPPPPLPPTPSQTVLPSLIPCVIQKSRDSTGHINSHTSTITDLPLPRLNTHQLALNNPPTLYASPTINHSSTLYTSPTTNNFKMGSHSSKPGPPPYQQFCEGPIMMPNCHYGPGGPGRALKKMVVRDLNIDPQAGLFACTIIFGAVLVAIVVAFSVLLRRRRKMQRNEDRVRDLENLTKGAQLH
ncbi:unnamed protein product [Periconia digitata]|uniref:Uncharacterized protein n=1 Tax=Periconia digitata TaxID=1303443 RepID=A0A9W4U2A2_9PLEO|nr:unnamed protein product [Periconia digitata]